uniref:Uncharacterized protein n=1 Tax=Opuntia streptacantha TaxID=393608 RepID=A0A7C8YI48_OPUST
MQSTRCSRNEDMIHKPHNTDTSCRFPDTNESITLYIPGNKLKMISKLVASAIPKVFLQKSYVYLQEKQYINAMRNHTQNTWKIWQKIFGILEWLLSDCRN